MPTHAEAAEFWRDWRKLTPEQRRAFQRARREFWEDLARGSFRPGLRVKGFKGSTNVFEMSWAADGRALWMYGDEVNPRYWTDAWQEGEREVDAELAEGRPGRIFYSDEEFLKALGEQSGIAEGER